MGNALTLKLEDGVRLAARWNFELGVTVKGRHLYLSAEGSLSEVDW